MAKGRRPKPLEIRKLQGNPGKRTMPRVSKSEPIDEGTPPPDWLPKEAKVIWRKKIADNAAIQLITKNDYNLLAAYCSAYARYVEAEKESHPAVIEMQIKVKLKKGYKIITRLVPNPWIKIQKQFFDQMEKCGAKFGFSPADRVKTGVIPGNGEEDEIGNFLNKKKA